MRLTILLICTGLLVMVGIFFSLAWPGDPGNPTRLELQEIASVSKSNDALRLELTGRGLDEQTRYSLYPDFGNRRVVDGQLQLYRQVHDILSQGDYLYIANDKAGLVICDISNPKEPVALSSLQLPGTAWRVECFGDLVLVLTVKDGLHLVDVSAPDFPILRHTVQLKGSLVDMACNDRFVYVSGYDEGIHIIDLIDPAQPALINTIKTPDIVRGIALQGDHLAVADNHQGLILYHGAATANLEFEVQRNLRIKVNHVAFADDNVLYFSGPQSLYILDVQQHDHSPRQILDNIFSIQSMAVVEEGLLLGTQQGIYVYSRGPSGVLTFSGFISNFSIVSSFSLAKGQIFFGDHQFGLQSFPVGSDLTAETMTGFPLRGEHHQIKVDGRRMLFSGQPYGLKMVEKQGPSGFKTLGRLHDNWNVVSIARGKDIVFLGGNQGDLTMIENRQGQFKLLNRLTLPGKAVAMVIHDDLLLIADYVAGLLCYDVSIPDNPVAVGALPSQGTTKGLALLGHQVFLADDHGGILVAELHESGRLREQERILPGKGVRAVATMKNSVVALLENGNLLQLKKNSQGRFRKSREVSVPGAANKIVATDECLYVYTRQGKILIYGADVDQIGLLPGIEELDISGSMINLRIQDRMLLVSAFNRGAYLFSLENPEHPTLIEHVQTSVKIIDFLVDGDQLVALNLDSSVSLVPRVGAQQKMLGRLGDRGWAVDVVGNLALLGSKDRLQVVDISLPGKMSIVAALKLPGDVTNIRTRGGTSFVAVRDQGLYLVDISNYRSLRLLGNVKTPGSALAVDLADGFALVASAEGGLISVDITDPVKPVIRDVLTLASPLNEFSHFVDVRVYGEFVFAADASNGLVVVRLSSSGEMKVVSHLATPDYLRGIFLHRKRLYLIDQKAGIIVVDVADPEKPQVVCSLGGIRAARYLWIEDEEILVLSGNSAVFTIPVPQDAIRVAGRADRLVTDFFFPKQPGYYTLRASGGAGFDEVVGRIQVSEKGTVRLHR